MPKRCPTAIFWYWNADPTPDGIRRQLAAIRAAGFQAVYVHPMPDAFHKNSFFKGMEIDYLGERFFALVRLVLQECKRLGLKMLLYDEAGWPSGGVLGRLVAAHPECEAKVLRRLPNGETYLATRTRPAPEIPVPELLDKRTTLHFIEMVHERYLAELGDEFGKTITGIFTDEPFFWCYTGTEEVRFHPAIVRGLRRKFGLSFWKEVLPRLWKGAPADGTTREMRRKYLSVCSDLFARNYTQVIARWCHKHHLQLEGHLDHDNEFFLTGTDMDFLTGLDGFDVPGVDAIWRQIYPAPDGTPGHYARLASSVAMRHRRQEALCECFNVYGYGLTGATMNWVACTLLHKGVNRLYPMPYLYEDKGIRKVCCSTDISPRVPTWDAMGALNRFWRWAADFNVGAVEADVWLFARCACPAPDSRLDPPQECRDADARMERLMDALDDAGVFWRFANELDAHPGRKPPRLLIAPNGTGLSDRQAAFFPRIETDIPSDIADFAPLDFIAVDGCRVRPVRRPDGPAVMLFNPNNKEATVRFRSRATWCDLVAPGDLYPRLKPLQQAEGAVSVTLPPWGLRLIREGVPEAAATWHATALPLEFRIVKKETLRLALEKPTHYETTICDEAFPASGRYTDDHRDFSGRLMLEARFNAAAAGDFLLEFPWAAHALRVSCNGRPCGERAFGPWLFAVRLKAGENRLRVRLSSSAGNEFRRCFREELEPAGYVNVYASFIKRYVIDDAVCGLAPTATLYAKQP